jgi:hypothetical protein
MKEGIFIMNENFTVTFYFTSGEKLLVVYSQEKFNEMIISLKKCWNDCYAIDDEFGFNFAQITHYMVEGKKNK